LKSRRVGPRSCVGNEVTENIRIMTTLVDFLLGLVAPRGGVFDTELGQQTHCVLYFLVFYFPTFYLFICLMLEH